MPTPRWSPWRPFPTRAIAASSTPRSVEFNMLEPKMFELIDLVFAPDDREQARELIEVAEWPREHERCQIAAIKCSDGRIDRLVSAIDQASIDYRDLLMAAGFGHDTTAHLRWTPEQK